MPDQIHTPVEPLPQGTIDPVKHLGALNLERYLKAEPELPAEAMHPDHEQRPEYEAAVSAMHTSQDRMAGNEHFLNKALTPAEDVATFNETFKSRLYSPMAWLAMMGVEHPSSRDAKLSADERLKAVQSLDGLVDLADQYIEGNRRAVAYNLELFAKVTSPERVDAFLERMATYNPGDFFNGALSHIEHYAGPDRSRQLRMPISPALRYKLQRANY